MCGGGGSCTPCPSAPPGFAILCSLVKYIQIHSKCTLNTFMKLSPGHHNNLVLQCGFFWTIRVKNYCIILKKCLSQCWRLLSWMCRDITATGTLILCRNHSPPFSALPYLFHRRLHGRKKDWHSSLSPQFKEQSVPQELRNQ